MIEAIDDFPAQNRIFSSIPPRFAPLCGGNLAGIFLMMYAA
jgi:hypothetical protein